MLCYDCDETARATCTHCGAHICKGHAASISNAMRRSAGMGQTTSPIPARRILCGTCHASHRAIHRAIHRA